MFDFNPDYRAAHSRKRKHSAGRDDLDSNRVDQRS